MKQGLLFMQLHYHPMHTVDTIYGKTFEGELNLRGFQCFSLQAIDILIKKSCHRKSFPMNIYYNCKNFPLNVLLFTLYFK